MQEDDEFGDLYTDVLSSFTTSPSLSVQKGVSVENDRQENTHFNPFNGGGSNSHQEMNRGGLDEPARVLEIDRNVNLANNRVLGFEDPNLVDESLINVIKDHEGEDVVVGDSVIASLSIPGVGDQGVFGEDNSDWNDSDSDDGLQILLNNYNAGQIGDGVEVDENGNVIDIVDEAAERRMEGQEWHEDTGILHGGFVMRDEDGERKELGDEVAKVNEVVQPPNIGVGYSNQSHSQFKFMRPGAAPLGGLVRPPLIVGPSHGYGRGEYCPAGLKNAPAMQMGHGMPIWTNNTPGHGFGRGLGFTLPSHKTVFEVDIDSFEEKPWRLPGVDISDFFNFDLNEETWKNYCKQLEQLRVEATMKSKIQVYESGRTEQNYDPDMPPELAAATGIQNISANKTNLGKAEIVHADVAKGSMGARPQLQTGRAILVETGYGERLPSIDTRPPRICDSDAIIEIVLKDFVDDDTVNGNDITELSEDDSNEGLRGDHENKDDAPIQNTSTPAEKDPVYTGPHQDERGKKGRFARSPSNGQSRSTSDKRSVCNQKDEPAENVKFKRSPHSLAYHTRGFTGEQYFEEKDAIHDDQLDGSSKFDRVDVDLNMEDTHKDEYSTQYLKKQRKKLGNELSLEDVDNREGSKAARRSDNSKAISGSTSDYRNLPYGTENEVVQDGRSTRMRIISKVNEGDHRARSKGREERQDMDRHHMVTKGREDLYYRKKLDSNPSHLTYHSHIKSDVIDRVKETDNFGGSLLRKDEESHGRTRFDNPRKRGQSHEMGPRHQSKVREIERSDSDQYMLRKQLDNGSRGGGYHDRFTGSRHWNRPDNSKSRTDSYDDLHGKQRKDDIHLKRDLGEKEEFLHVRRESTSHQNRERVDIMEQRKRDNDIARIRNNDQQSMMHKEGIRFPRERVNRQRDDGQRLKRSHEETRSKRERVDVRGVKTGRTGEEKSRSSHSRAMDELKASDREYHLKDSGYRSEQYKRKDKVETENHLRRRVSEDIYSRETRLRNDERRFRQERLNTLSDRVVASDHHRMPEKKNEEYSRKSKESEEDYNSVVPSKINRDDHYSQISEQVKMKGMIEQGSGDQVIPVSHQSSIKHKKDASDDDEQHEFMRGHSKSERWTSRKERDFNALTKSSSLNVKDTDEHKKIATLAANKVPNESLRAVQTGQNPCSLASGRHADDLMDKDGKVKPEEDNHLDGVAKLKKRSEQFKLPVPSEKEVGAVKKTENKELPPVQTDRMDLEIKQE